MSRGLSDRKESVVRNGVEPFLAKERQCQGPGVRCRLRYFFLGEDPARLVTGPYVARAGSAQPLPRTLHVAPKEPTGHVVGEALDLVC